MTSRRFYLYIYFVSTSVFQGLGRGGRGRRRLLAEQSTARKSDYTESLLSLLESMSETADRKQLNPEAPVEVKPEPCSPEPAETFHYKVKLEPQEESEDSLVTPVEPEDLTFDSPHSSELWNEVMKDHLYCVNRKNVKKCRGGSGPFEFSGRVFPDARTSGRKYCMADTDFGEVASETDDGNTQLNVMMQVLARSKAIASRLVIPMIRVRKSSVLGMVQNKESNTADSEPSGMVLVLRGQMWSLFENQAVHFLARYIVSCPLLCGMVAQWYHAGFETGWSRVRIPLQTFESLRHSCQQGFYTQLL